MNIFATDKCPIKSARYLDDRRVNKMIIESCQMLSTFVRIRKHKLTPEQDAKLYKKCFVNHPCNVWLRESNDNVAWLFKHTNELIKIWRTISDNRHGSWDCFEELTKIMLPFMSTNLSKSPQSFCNCSEYQHIDVGGVHIAYQQTMLIKWYMRDKAEPKWTFRDKPQWELMK